MSDKMVIGLSDATALLHTLHLHGHGRLFHGPFLDTLAAAEPATRDDIRRWLHTPDAGGGFDLVEVAGNASAQVQGKLLGGNLTMLASMIGGPFAVQARDSILMLEDVTEHAFRMDRCLVQLRASGALEGVRAIVLGEFVRCYLPKNASYTASELVADLLRPLGVPILQGAPFGHGPLHLAWPYGRQARLEGGRLTF